MFDPFILHYSFLSIDASLFPAKAAMLGIGQDAGAVESDFSRLTPRCKVCRPERLDCLLALRWERSKVAAYESAKTEQYPCLTSGDPTAPAPSVIFNLQLKKRLKELRRIIGVDVDVLVRQVGGPEDAEPSPWCRSMGMENSVWAMYVRGGLVELGRASAVAADGQFAKADVDALRDRSPRRSSRWPPPAVPSWDRCPAQAVFTSGE